MRWEKLENKYIVAKNKVRLNKYTTECEGKCLASGKPVKIISYDKKLMNKDLELGVLKKIASMRINYQSLIEVIEEIEKLYVVVNLI